MAAKTAWKLARDTWERFSLDNGDLLAAGISFYVLLSAAPLGLLVISVAGLVIGEQRAREQLVSALTQSASSELANAVAHLLDAARETGAQVAGLVAALVALWAASRLFVQLQSALNSMWGVRVSRNVGARQLAKRVAFKRFTSFMMVIGCGVLLILLVVAEAVASVVARTLQIPDISLSLARIPELGLSLGLLTLLIATIYRVLPDVRIPWRDVWIGALLTATLIRLSAFAISTALAHFGMPGTYGVLGWLAVLTLWTYALAQVFLLGAAFTRVFAEYKEGKEVEPEPHAELTQEV